MKLEAKKRLKSSEATDKMNGRHQDWFNGLKAEEQDSYKKKYPGTKFVHKMKLTAP